MKNGLGIGNYLVIATDKKNGVSNEMRITLEKSIADTIYLPLNMKCGIGVKEEPTVKVEPVVKEVTK